MKFFGVFALFIVAVSCDVAHLSKGYNYPKPEGRRLELPKVDNDYLPPSEEGSDFPETTSTTTTTTTTGASQPSNEYLPAVDPITNDYLPPSADEPEDQVATTVANEV